MRRNPGAVPGFRHTDSGCCATRESAALAKRDGAGPGGFSRRSGGGDGGALQAVGRAAGVADGQVQGNASGERDDARAVAGRQGGAAGQVADAALLASVAVGRVGTGVAMPVSIGIEHVLVRMPGGIGIAVRAARMAGSRQRLQWQEQTQHEKDDESAHGGWQDGDGDGDTGLRRSAGWTLYRERNSVQSFAMFGVV